MIRNHTLILNSLLEDEKEQKGQSHIQIQHVAHTKENALNIL